MLKARANGRDGELLIFGLSEMNLKKLKEGRPIQIDLTEMGLNGTMLIFYGKDEIAMAKQLEPFLGPDTKVFDLTKGNTQGEGSA